MRFILLEVGWQSLKKYLEQNNLQDYIDIINNSQILKKYSNFVLKLLKNSKSIDFNELENLLKRFERYKPKLDKKDIMQYNSLEELQGELDSVELSKKERKEIGAEYLGTTHHNYKVFWIKTEEAAKLYGKGTKWCISAEVNNMFDDYNKEYYIYFFIGNVDKYALVIGRDINIEFDGDIGVFSFYDSEDNKNLFTWYEDFVHYIPDSIKNKMKGDEIIRAVTFYEIEKLDKILTYNYKRIYNYTNIIRILLDYWYIDDIEVIIDTAQDADLLLEIMDKYEYLSTDTIIKIGDKILELDAFNLYYYLEKVYDEIPKEKFYFYLNTVIEKEPSAVRFLSLMDYILGKCITKEEAIEFMKKIIKEEYIDPLKFVEHRFSKNFTDEEILDIYIMSSDYEYLIINLFIRMLAYDIIKNDKLLVDKVIEVMERADKDDVLVYRNLIRLLNVLNQKNSKELCRLFDEFLSFSSLKYLEVVIKEEGSDFGRVFMTTLKKCEHLLPKFRSIINSFDEKTKEKILRALSDSMVES